MVEALPVEHFSQQASHMTHQQHLQMGLRKGMAILIYYVIGNTHYQAVLLAEESVMNRGRRGENRLWKRVTPSVTEFAWLPPNIAESFCKNALHRDAVRTHCAFDTPHLGLDTKNFVADVFVEKSVAIPRGRVTETRNSSWRGRGKGGRKAKGRGRGNKFRTHFLKLPSFDGICGKITRNVNPSPPDEHIVRWLRAQGQVTITPGSLNAMKGINLLFFLARCCLGQVPGGAPFSQRSEQATACTNRMQIRN